MKTLLLLTTLLSFNTLAQEDMIPAHTCMTKSEVKTIQMKSAEVGYKAGYNYARDFVVKTSMDYFKMKCSQGNGTEVDFGDGLIMVCK